jgi:acyl carrier protein
MSIASLTTTTPVQSDTRTQVRDFIMQRFPARELGEHEDIFALGYVNSLFAMQLVLFAEKTFGISIASEDLEIDNFRSVAAISALVERRRTGSGRWHGGREGAD